MGVGRDGRRISSALGRTGPGLGDSSGTHTHGCVFLGKDLSKIIPIDFHFPLGLWAMAPGFVLLHMLSSFYRPTLILMGKLTSRRGRWSARIREPQPLSHSHSINMITKKRKRDMHGATAVSDTLIRYGGGFSGLLGRLRPELSSQIVGNWGLFARRQNSTECSELNSSSALSIQSSSPRFCTKTSGGMGLVQGWGAGDRGAGTKGHGQGQGCS